MQVRRVAAVATLAVLAAGAYSPATAAAKKPPVKKSYDMTLLPVADPPQSSMGDSCTRPQLDGVSVHSESLTTTGPGTLTVKVNGFAGDWDITVVGPEGTEGIGSGTSTGPAAPATAGEDVVQLKFKKAISVKILTCNFAGSPKAHGEFSFTYAK
jgi:hypothetical protein